MMAALALLCAVLAAVLTGLALAPAVDGMVNRIRLSRRVAALPWRSVAAGHPRPTGRTASPLLRSGGRGSDALVQRWLPGGDAVAAQLAAAGGRPGLTALVAVAAGAAVTVAGLALALGLPAPMAVLLVPVLAIGGARLASAALAARARAKFVAGFADAVAVLIRSLRAGLSVTAAVGEVARAGDGPVARAFGGVVEAMALGQPLETALWAAARAIGVPDFDFFVVTVALQRETGGNLAETLDGLDATLRMRRQLALKVKALAAEARASAMIIGSLPFAMAGLLWMTSPDYLVPLFTTPLGKAMLGAGLASMAIGALVIREMMAIRT